MVINTEIHMWLMYRELETMECSALLEQLYHVPLPKAQRSFQKKQNNFKNKRWQMTIRKECFLDTLGQLNTLIPASCDSTICPRTGKTES